MRHVTVQCWYLGCMRRANYVRVSWPQPYPSNYSNALHLEYNLSLAECRRSIIVIGKMKPLQVSIASCWGGLLSTPEATRRQAAELEKGTQIIVATPRRMANLLFGNGYYGSALTIDWSQVKAVLLADVHNRTYKSFLSHVQKIVNECSSNTPACLSFIPILLECYWTNQTHVTDVVIRVI